MISGNLLNSNSRIPYPRASRWLKEQAAIAKLDTTYDLAHIETVTAHKDFNEYLRIKEKFAGGIQFRDTLLYKDWLNSQIDESNASVYNNIFMISQDIRYFRNFFKQTEEEEIRNSKGQIIELKAYGKSNKMNRDVIVFEGRFLNGKLSSYKDKTDTATGYTRIHSGNDNDIVRENLTQYLKTIIENDCADVFSEKAMRRIICNTGAIILLIDLGMTHLIPRGTVDEHISAVRDLKILLEKDLHHLLSPGKLQSIVNSDLTLYDELSQRILKEIESGKHIFLFPNVGGPFSRLKEFQLPTYDYNHNATPLGSFYKLQDIAKLVRERVEIDYLFSERYYDKSWTPGMKAKIRDQVNDSLRDMILNRMTQAIKSAEIRQAELSRQDYIVKEPVIQHKASYSSKAGKNGKWMTIMGMIAVSCLFYWKNSTKTDSISDSTRVSIKDSSLESYLQSDTLPDGTTIYITPGEYIISAESGKDVTIYIDSLRRKKQRIKAIPQSPMEIEKVVADMGYFTAYTDDKGRNSQPGWIEMRHLQPKQIYQRVVSRSGDVLHYAIGSYIVPAEMSLGVVYLKKDKKKSQSRTIPPFTEIRIIKVEGSLGYFDSFYDESMNTIPNGWIEMDNLEPLSGYLTHPNGKKYWIKSDLVNVVTYKDILKQKTNSKKLNGMEEINVLLIKGNLAYFNNGILDDYFKGWIEMEKIEEK
jgi:hypothetical protein